MSRMDKASSQYIHVKKRAKERFGFEIDKQIHDDIVKAILNKSSPYKAEFVFRQSTRVQLYRIIFSNESSCMVCYDSKRKSIATIFPEDEKIRYVSLIIDVFGNTLHTSEVFGVKSLWLDENGDIKNLNYEHVTRCGDEYHFIDKDVWYSYDGNVFHQMMK